MTVESRLASGEGQSATSLSGSAGRLLNQITTQWSIVTDPAKLVVRYAPAIRSYLEAILRNANDADEVSQEFALHVLNHKFDKASPDRGRFRDYIKVSARNAAMAYLRRKRRAGQASLSSNLERILASSDAGDNPAAAASDDWLNHWRRCLVDKVWRALESHELRSNGNLHYTVLSLSIEYPNEDSESLAARAAERAARPLRADAFRKQLSRARRMFAQLLAQEVAATLQQPIAASELEEELIELGLMSYLREYLPDSNP